ncbi:hypothetical protein [Ruegeria arenilitoris]|uniref:hypothetical protein n=1 Tax=Ruegeria arenilitoris TaxID=1173585 RepID=UPI00147CF75B|nr:hypothetical protein [Ruegeria arenilitoris]
MDDFYAARSRVIPPLPWSTFSPPFSDFSPSVQEIMPKSDDPTYPASIALLYAA